MAVSVGEGAEQRKYARIEASIACSVATAVDAFDAEVANLSRGGAGIVGPPKAAKVGERVTLLLKRVSLPGKIVRIAPSGERVFYGMQFGDLSNEADAELVKLLHALAGGKGTGRREHPRVAARVDVKCKSENSFRGMLSDLSKGGLSVKTLRDVELGKTMTVAFGLKDAKRLVEISGEVVSSQKLEHGFRLGVHFKPLSDEQKEAVGRALDELLGIQEAEILPDD